MVSQVIKYLTYAILQQSWKTSVMYWSYSRGGCNQLQVRLPHLYLSCSLWTHIRLALSTGINHQQLPPPRPIYTTPHSPPQFFFGAVGKVKVYTWNPILQQDTIEFLFFGPKLLYGMLVIGPKDTTIALKKKTMMRSLLWACWYRGGKYTWLLIHWVTASCVPLFVYDCKILNGSFFQVKMLRFRICIGPETLVHFTKRMVKSFYYHNSTLPQWKPPGLSGLSGP